MSSDMSHLEKSPTVIVCYHGLAILGIENIETGERRIAARIFGHAPVTDESEIDPSSEVVEILLTESEVLELMTGLLTGYEGITGVSMYGGSPN